MGPKPHEEAALGPGPSLGRVGDDAHQQEAGVQLVHPSAPLAGVCQWFSVSRRVASRRSVSSALGCEAMNILAPPTLHRWCQLKRSRGSQDGASCGRAAQPLDQLRGLLRRAGRAGAAVRRDACALLFAGPRGDRRRADTGTAMEAYLELAPGASTSFGTPSTNATTTRPSRSTQHTGATRQATGSQFPAKALGDVELPTQWRWRCWSLRLAMGWSVGLPALARGGMLRLGLTRR